MPAEYSRQKDIFGRTVSRSKNTVDRLKILLRLCMQLFGLTIQLLKPSLRIDVDGIFGRVADVETLLECLRRSCDALRYTLQAHLRPVLEQDQSRFGDEDRGEGQRNKLCLSLIVQLWQAKWIEENTVQ